MLQNNELRGSLLMVSLARLGLVAEHYYLLSCMGARKRYATDFDPGEAEQVFDNIVAVLRPGPVTI